MSEATLLDQRSVALYGDMTFIFRRSFFSGQGHVQWELYATLRSSDYDFDVYGQDYRIALATNRRSLLVEAPNQHRLFYFDKQIPD